MKKNNLLYWISTGLFCAFLLLTSISYFTDPQFVEIFKHLGFPQFFRIELGIAKILGVVLLLLPMVSPKVKEWTYAGFGITLISGALAHLNSGDSFGYIINVLFWFSLLVISYVYWNKRKKDKINSTIV